VDRRFPLDEWSRLDLKQELVVLVEWLVDRRFPLGGLNRLDLKQELQHLGQRME